MMRSLALLIISISLIVSPALGVFFDIQAVCDQTPGIGLFGEYLRLNPDIYQIYAARRNSTFYIPHDTAMNRYFAETGTIYRRTTAAETVKAAYHIANERNALNAERNKKRSVQKAGDNVIVLNSPSTTLAKRQLQLNNTVPRTAGITISTGLGAKSEILYGDIECIQGLIQVIDTIFTVPEPVTDTLEFTDRTRFLATINDSGLADRYNNMENITIFAPTNSAFTNQSTLGTAAIQYHVIENAALYSPLLVDGAVHVTAAGSNLYVSVVDDEIYINCVRITQSDAITSNGVIHTVEQILTPLASPPSCGGAPFNSTGPVQFTGSAPAGKATSIWAIIGTIFVMVGLAI